MRRVAENTPGLSITGDLILCTFLCCFWLHHRLSFAAVDAPELDAPGLDATPGLDAIDGYSIVLVLRLTERQALDRGRTPPLPLNGKD